MIWAAWDRGGRAIVSEKEALRDYFVAVEPVFGQAYFLLPH